jgi:hypothetical protein
MTDVLILTLALSGVAVVIIYAAILAWLFVEEMNND